MNKSEYDELLRVTKEKLRGAFKLLADSFICPSCNKRGGPERLNLGEKFNSFEGCKECHDEVKKDE